MDLGIPTYKLGLFGGPAAPGLEANGSKKTIVYIYIYIYII